MNPWYWCGVWQVPWAGSVPSTDTTLVSNQTTLTASGIAVATLSTDIVVLREFCCLMFQIYCHDYYYQWNYIICCPWWEVWVVCLPKLQAAVYDDIHPPTTATIGYTIGCYNNNRQSPRVPIILWAHIKRKSFELTWNTFKNSLFSVPAPGFCMSSSTLCRSLTFSQFYEGNRH